MAIYAGNFPFLSLTLQNGYTKTLPCYIKYVLLGEIWTGGEKKHTKTMVSSIVLQLEHVSVDVGGSHTKACLPSVQCVQCRSSAFHLGFEFALAWWVHHNLWRCHHQSICLIISNLEANRFPLSHFWISYPRCPPSPGLAFCRKQCNQTLP